MYSHTCKTRQTRRHSPSRLPRTRQTRRHLPNRLPSTRQTRRHSPSRLPSTRQTRRHSPNRLPRTRYIRHSIHSTHSHEFGEFGASGHCLKKMHSFILLVHFRSHLHWISLTITTIIICLYAKFFSFSVYQPKSKSTFCQQKVLWSTEHLRKHFCLFPTKKYNSIRFTLYPRLFERQYVKETSLN